MSRSAMVERSSAEITGHRIRSLGWIGLVYLVAAAAAAGAGWPLHRAGLHPLIIAGLADLAATVVVFGFSVLLDNSSVYDPYWSVVPPLLGGYYLLAAGPAANPLRASACLGLVALWGARLTFNWIRRWRGLSDEDWRYVAIREKTRPLHWPASLVAVHLLPTAWVFAGCLPLLAAMSASGRQQLGLLDLLAVLVTASAILIETLADRQLHCHLLAASPDRPSFLDTGLWAWCRHPNYLGEVLFWWGLFGFGLAAAPSAWWWTAIGPVSITVLFVAISVPMIDRRMVRRRPGYAAWIARVPALVPRPWRRR